jgi:phage-related protein
MANYSYGGLLVRVTGDTGPLTQKVHADAVKAGNDAGRTMGQRISAGIGRATGSIGKGLATTLGTATLAATAFAAKSIKVAANVDKMRTALSAVAHANGLSTAAVQGTVEALRKQGLTVEAATSVTTDFVKEHLGLANAVKLSTVAQNASVISGKSVSDVMELITRSVSTGNTRILRQAGLVVNTKDAFKTYAESIGTTASKLTGAQRSQAIMNAVMESGQHIAGAWAATLNDPARVLASFPRLAHDIQVSLGEQLLKSFGPLIVSIGKMARGLKDALAPGGALAPVLKAVGDAAAKILAPFTQVINLSAKWIATLKPGQLNGMSDAIGKFAPEIASIGAALSAFAGGQFLTKIPVVGEMFAGLGGPIGIVVSALAALALTSPDARKALGQLAATVAGALAPVMKALMPIVAQLGQVFATLLAAGLNAVLPLVPALTVVLLAALHVITPLVPAITALANILAVLLPYIVPLVAIWYAWTLALKAWRAAVVATEVVIFAIKNATMIWTFAQEALNVALLANPIGIVVLALAALSAAIYLAWTRSATFRKIVIASWQAIRDVVLVVTNFVRDHWQGLLQILLAITTGGMGNLVLLIVQKWGAIRSAVAGAVTAVRTAVSGAWSAVYQNTARTWSAVFTAVTGFVTRLRDGALLAMTGLRNSIASILASIRSTYFSVWSAVANFVTGTITRIRNTVTGAMTSLRDSVAGLLGSIRDTYFRVWSGIATSVGGFAGRIRDAVVNGLRSLLSSAGGLLGQIGGRFRDGFNSIVGSAVDAGANIVNGIKQGILNAISGIGGWVKGAIVDPIIGAVKGFFGIASPSTVMISIGWNLIRGLVVGLLKANLGGIIHQVFGGFPQALAAMLGRGLVTVAMLPKKALNAVKSIGGVAIGGISGALKKLGGALGFAAGGVIREPVTGFGHNTGTVYKFAERGPELVSPLTRHPAGHAGLGAAPVVINVYPQAGQSEQAIAASVSRQLAWAGAGGAR